MRQQGNYPLNLVDVEDLSDDEELPRVAMMRARRRQRQDEQDEDDDDEPESPPPPPPSYPPPPTPPPSPAPEADDDDDDAEPQFDVQAYLDRELFSIGVEEIPLHSVQHRLAVNQPVEIPLPAQNNRVRRPATPPTPKSLASDEEEELIDLPPRSPSSPAPPSDDDTDDYNDHQSIDEIVHTDYDSPDEEPPLPPPEAPTPQHGAFDFFADEDQPEIPDMHMSGLLTDEDFAYIQAEREQRQRQEQEQQLQFARNQIWYGLTDRERMWMSSTPTLVPGTREFYNRLAQLPPLPNLRARRGGRK
jgi:hypothetical protein